MKFYAVMSYLFQVFRRRECVSSPAYSDYKRFSKTACFNFIILNHILWL